ncbi:hypothetical protein scyTo_0014081 [Scyliorhinus torazame]|uniref:Uncharacterized protein n=1 Tax=Scyliorhinus torazame TaxID=75743 RepID=A0A401NG87_SCYTO|nr:hypothetical protein [Scyliorhinus torazame]
MKRNVPTLPESTAPVLSSRHCTGACACKAAPPKVVTRRSSKRLLLPASLDFVRLPVGVRSEHRASGGRQPHTQHIGFQDCAGSGFMCKMMLFARDTMRRSKK